jgi:hypothetical protein
LTSAYPLPVVRAFDKVTIDVAKAPTEIFDRSGDLKSAKKVKWQAHPVAVILHQLEAVQTTLITQRFKGAKSA